MEEKQGRKRISGYISPNHSQSVNKYAKKTYKRYSILVRYDEELFTKLEENGISFSSLVRSLLLQHFKIEDKGEE